MWGLPEESLKFSLQGNWGDAFFFNPSPLLLAHAGKPGLSIVFETSNSGSIRMDGTDHAFRVHGGGDALLFRTGEGGLTAQASVIGVVEFEKKAVKVKIKPMKRQTDDGVMFVGPPQLDDEDKAAMVASAGKTRKNDSTKRLKVEEAHSPASASVAKSLPKEIVVTLKECVIHELAPRALTLDELIEKTSDIADASSLTQVLSVVAKRGSDGRYDLIEDASVWSAVNPDDPDYTEEERALVRKRLQVRFRDGKPPTVSSSPMPNKRSADAPANGNGSKPKPEGASQAQIERYKAICAQVKEIKERFRMYAKFLNGSDQPNDALEKVVRVEYDRDKPLLEDLLQEAKMIAKKIMT